jgi:hypothetical protein
MASFNPALRSFLLLCLYSILATATSCYNPDGDLILDPAYQPCVQTLGAISMCCATNRTTNADVCQSNGLCHNPCLASGQECDGSSQGQYWRESCTDQSWSSPYCLSGICINISVSRKWRRWQGCRLMEIDWRVAERKHWNVPVLDRWHLVLRYEFEFRTVLRYEKSCRLGGHSRCFEFEYNRYNEQHIVHCIKHILQSNDDISPVEYCNTGCLSFRHRRNILFQYWREDWTWGWYWSGCSCHRRNYNSLYPVATETSNKYIARHTEWIGETRIKWRE